MQKAFLMVEPKSEMLGNIFFYLVTFNSHVKSLYGPCVSYIDRTQCLDGDALILKTSDNLWRFFCVSGLWDLESRSQGCCKIPFLAVHMNDQVHKAVS